MFINDWNQSDSVNDDYDLIWLKHSNECLLLTQMRKAGSNRLLVMGSNGDESLEKPSMLYYIDGISGEQLWLALWLLMYLYAYLSNQLKRSHIAMPNCGLLYMYPVGFSSL